MARKPKTVRLAVFLNNRQVGHLIQEANGAISFRYASTWLSWDRAFAVSLSLPLREERYIGAPVLAVFDNLLPDNETIRRSVAERVGAEGVDAISLLSALGRDCVGALQFLPEGVDPGPAGRIEGDPVSEAQIAEVLRNLATDPLGMVKTQDFRISIAGAQEKTALLKLDEAWLRPVGATPTTHILKPQIGKLPNGLDLSNSVENEHLCLEITRAFGIPTAKTEMANFEDRRVLVVERFDRLRTDDGRLLRIPQEDMCQALGVAWTRKYENEGGPGILQIEDLLAGSDEPTLDRLNFLKANIVFWLLGATDGHAKNFSLALYPRGGFRLTPLYDVISAQPSFDGGKLRHNRFRLAMAAGSRRHYGILDLHRRHFIETADSAGMSKMAVSAMIDELIETSDKALDQSMEGLPGDFPGRVATSIIGGIKARLAQLAREGAQA